MLLLICSLYILYRNIVLSGTDGMFINIVRFHHSLLNTVALTCKQHNSEVGAGTGSPSISFYIKWECTQGYLTEEGHPLPS